MGRRQGDTDLALLGVLRGGGCHGDEECASSQLNLTTRNTSCCCSRAHRSLPVSFNRFKTNQHEQRLKTPAVHE
ncbi:unnamed protein product [Lota lota]